MESSLKISTKAKELTHWGERTVPPTLLNKVIQLNPIQETEIFENDQNVSKLQPIIDDDLIMIKKLIKRYSMICMISAGSFFSIAATLLIISIIGYRYPVQTTGYQCLRCPTNYYFTSGYCTSKKLNGSCYSSIECREDLGLSCNFGMCQCSSLNTWSNVYQTCKFRENITCSLNSDCCEPMNCASNACHCGSFQYHDTSLLSCIPQKIYKQSCSIDYNCRVDKYLQCLNGQCDCTPVYPTNSIGQWNSTSSTCLNCPNGWLLNGHSCYKGVDCPTAFENLTSALIQSSCGSYNNIGLASGLNSLDLPWLKYIPVTQNASYFGSINSLYCEIYDGSAIYFHACTHGIVPQHGILCKFDVI